MASEHIVKLKAVLDTSSVKAQLNGMQGAGTASGSGISQQAQLIQALNKLNLSIGNLNQKVQQAAGKGAGGGLFGMNRSQLMRIAGVNAIGGLYAQTRSLPGAQQGHVQSILGGAAQGAAMGLAAGPWGAAVGAALGGVKDAIDVFIENATRQASKLMGLAQHNVQRMQYYGALENREIRGKVDAAIYGGDLKALHGVNADLIGKRNSVRELIDINEQSGNFQEAQKLWGQYDFLSSMIDSIEKAITDGYDKQVKKEEEDRAQREFEFLHKSDATGKYDFSNLTDESNEASEFGAEYNANVLKNVTQRQNDLLGQQEWQLDTLLKGIRENQAMSGLGAIGGSMGENDMVVDNISETVKKVDQKMQQMVETLKKIADLSEGGSEYILR